MTNSSTAINFYLQPQQRPKNLSCREGGICFDHSPLQFFIYKIISSVNAETHKDSYVIVAGCRRRYRHFIRTIITIVISKNLFVTKYVIDAETDTRKIFLLPFFKHGEEISETQVHLIVPVCCPFIVKSIFAAFISSYIIIRSSCCQ